MKWLIEMLLLIVLITLLQTNRNKAFFTLTIYSSRMNYQYLYTL